MSKKNITIAGLDGLDLLKKEIISGVFNIGLDPTYDFNSCSIVIDKLQSSFEMTEKRNVSKNLSSFNEEFKYADILFFANGKDKNISLDFGNITLVNPKLVIFCCDNANDLLKITRVDLKKSYPNAAIAGFVFNSGKHKMLTKFLNEKHFYEKLSDKGLLGWDMFYKLCNKSVTSSYFYSFNIEGTYIENYTADIMDYKSYEFKLQELVNKGTKYTNSSLFVGSILCEAFEAFAQKEELKSVLNVIKSKYPTFVRHLKKKDVKSIQSDSLPVRYLKDVRPGDIMLSKDTDKNNENFKIVTSVSKSGDIEFVGYPDKKKNTINYLSSSITSIIGSDKNIIFLRGKSKVDFTMESGNTHTRVSATIDNDTSLPESSTNIQNITIKTKKNNTTVDKVFFFIRPIIFTNIFEKSSYDPSIVIVPEPVVNKSTTYNAYRKELDKYAQEVENKMSNYKIIKYINNTALKNFNNEYKELGFFAKIGFDSTCNYWNELKKRIIPINKSLSEQLTDERIESLYYKKVSDKSFDLLPEIHRDIFGVEYDKDLVNKANEIFNLYVTIKRLKLMQNSIQNSVNNIKNDSIIRSILFAFASNEDPLNYNKLSNINFSCEYETLLSLMEETFGVEKDFYRGYSTQNLYIILGNYIKTISFITSILPNLELYASYYSLKAFGFDFPSVVRVEEKLFADAKFRSEIIKFSILTILGMVSGPLASKVLSSAGKLVLAVDAAGNAANAAKITLLAGGIDAYFSILVDSLDISSKVVNGKACYKDYLTILLNGLLTGVSSIGVGFLSVKLTSCLNSAKEAAKEAAKKAKEIVIKRINDNFTIQMIDKLNKLIKTIDNELIDLNKKTASIVVQQKDLDKINKLDEVSLSKNMEKENIKSDDVIFQYKTKDGKELIEITYTDIYIRDIDPDKILKNELFKDMEEMYAKETQNLTVREKTQFLIRKKRELLENEHKRLLAIKTQKEEAQKYLTKLRDSSTNRIEAEREIRNILGDDSFSLSGKDKASDIQDRIEQTLNKKEQEAINEIEIQLENIEFLFSCYGSFVSNLVSYGLTNLKSIIFDNNNPDCTPDELISKNITTILSSIVNEEEIDKFINELCKYRLTSNEVSDVVEIIKENPFVYVNDVNVPCYREFCLDPKLKEYKILSFSDDFINIAKDKGYDGNYNEIKHIKVGCYVYLANELYHDNKLDYELFEVIDDYKKKKNSNI